MNGQAGIVVSIKHRNLSKCMSMSVGMLSKYIWRDYILSDGKRVFIDLSYKLSVNVFWADV